MNVQQHTNADSKLSVLHIEDNPGDARLVQEMLPEADGFKVTVAGTMAEALAGIEKDPPGVILLDLSLPDARGLEAIVSLRHRAPDIAVVALTGFDDDAMALKVVQAGAQDYLTKGNADSTVLRRAISFAMARQSLHIKREEQVQQEISELESALDLQQQLTGWQSGSQAAQAAGVGPLYLRSPQIFAVYLTDYETLLDAYLDTSAMHKPSPRRQISELAERIGDQGCGPRDVVDIHLKVVAKKGKESNSQRTQAYAVEGRLLALEVMGYLVDYYRLGRKRVKSEE